MKTFLILFFILLPSICFATPFLVCDPQTGVTHYILTGPSWVPTTVPAQADGSLKMDVSSATVGNNSLTVAACMTDATWGEACSASVPFVFVRPAAAVAPVGIKLIK